MKVDVKGCVKKMGPMRLSPGATVRAAIQAAGGLGRGEYRAHGQVTIRSPRRSDGRYYLRRKLNVHKDRSHYTVQLRDGDVLVVAYHVVVK